MLRIFGRTTFEIQFMQNSRALSFVMPALVAGIHVFLALAKAWMAGTSPAMTQNGDYKI
jgi:hypothetical protein